MCGYHYGCLGDLWTLTQRYLSFLTRPSYADHLPRRLRRHAHGAALRSQLRDRRHQPCPHVRRFWSFTRNAADLGQLCALLVAHGEADHCLLKGSLERALRHESRAGRTDPNTPTDLLVLDLDFDQGFTSIDEFMEAIGLSGVSYVLHHSSSAGITAQPCLRVHVFVQLSSPVAPAQLKLWLRHLNRTISGLREQVTLSANGMTPRWPLDVPSCQNDKLLFIADPVVKGLADPLAGRRFELCQRGIESVELRTEHLDPGAVQRSAEGLVSELRARAGLPERRARYVALPGRERLLTNPERATVTGVRRARGFFYLNLNGGDSWAYYFPEVNADIVRSFEGDPPMRLADLAPGLWEQVRPRDPFAQVA